MPAIFPRLFVDRYGKRFHVSLTHNPREVVVTFETGEAFYFSPEIAECVAHTINEAASHVKGEG